MLNVKYKTVKTEVPHNRISTIKSLDKVRNITLEVVLDKVHIYDLNDIFLVIMSIKDDTGVMSAMLIVNRDEMKNNSIDVDKIISKDKYKINGNVMTDISFICNVLNILTKGEIIFKKNMFHDKMLLVRAIQKIERKKERCKNG